MKHLFIDTDVILDFVGDRKPFSVHASKIFVEAHKGKFKLYASGNSITTVYYILCKSVDEKKARTLVLGLLGYLEIIPVSDTILVSAFNSGFKDFEDGVQHYCAVTNKRITQIVTRNIRDYKKSKISVVSSEQLFI